MAVCVDDGFRFVQDRGHIRVLLRLAEEVDIAVGIFLLYNRKERR